MTETTTETTTQSEIAALEERVAELRRQRADVEARLNADREDRASSLLAGVKARKPDSALATQLDDLDLAVERGKAELERLRERQRAEAEAAKEGERVASLRKTASALTRITEHIEQVIAEVDTLEIDRRRAVWSAVGRALRQSVDDSSSGRPASVRAALAEAAQGYERDADRASAAPRLAQGRPLPMDTAIYCMRNITWSDANSMKRAYMAGAIVLVPRGVAIEAQARRVADILEPPSGVRIRIRRTTPSGLDGQSFVKGAEIVLNKDFAERLFREGAAEPRGELTPAEIAGYRANHPERAHTWGHEVDLGLFNNLISDGARALDEVARSKGEDTDDEAPPVEPATREKFAELAAAAN